MCNAGSSEGRGRSTRLGVVSTFAAAMLAATVGLVATQATAATLNVDGTGQLIGATGVDVGGTLYDVEFLDGTCIAIFSGCDEISDFTFQSSAAALQAAQALLDQVFVDDILGLFDSDHLLTVGCDTAVRECQAITPFDVEPTVGDVAQAVNRSSSSPQADAANLGTFTPAVSTAGTLRVWASWTPAAVPEPSTAVLLGLGLAFFSTRRGYRRAR